MGSFFSFFWKSSLTGGSLYYEGSISRYSIQAGYLRILNLALFSISSFPSSLERGKDDLRIYVERWPRAIVSHWTYVAVSNSNISSNSNIALRRTKVQSVTRCVHCTVLYTTVNTQTTQYTEAAGSAVYYSPYHICPGWHKCPGWRPQIYPEVRKLVVLPVRIYTRGFLPIPG